MPFKPILYSYERLHSGNHNWEMTPYIKVEKKQFPDTDVSRDGSASAKSQALMAGN